MYTEREQLKDILENAMKRQNVSYRPNAKYMHAAENNMIKEYGGLYQVCRVLGIPSKSEWKKLVKIDNDVKEISPAVKKIIFDAMEIQEVDYQPKSTNFPGSHKRLLEMYGGLKEVCKQMGILTKAKKLEAIEQGYIKTLERREVVELRNRKKLHANDVY